MSFLTKLIGSFGQHTSNASEPREDYQTKEQFDADVRQNVKENVENAVIDFLDFEYVHPKTSFVYTLDMPKHFSPVKRQMVVNSFVNELEDKYNIKVIKYHDYMYHLSRK